MFETRLVSYPDTHKHSLGTNYTQIPVNCPVTGAVFNPHMRDGGMNVNGNLGAHPNYLATSHPVEFKQFSLQEEQEVWEGAACPFHWKATDDEYKQASDLYKVMERYPNAQAHLAHNVAVHVQAADPHIQDRVFEMFSKVNGELGAAIKKETLQLSPRK